MCPTELNGLISYYVLADFIVNRDQSGGWGSFLNSGDENVIDEIDTHYQSENLFPILIIL